MIKLIKIAGAFLRGAFKSLPMGNAIIEGINNAKGGVLKTIVTKEGETIEGLVKEPHDWVSVITQVAFVSLIVWAVFTGKLDIKEALGWLNG